MQAGFFMGSVDTAPFSVEPTVAPLQSLSGRNPADTPNPVFCDLLRPVAGLLPYGA